MRSKPRNWDDISQGAWRVIVVLAFLLVAAMAINASYNGIVAVCTTHRVNMPVQFGSDWAIGDSRTCTLREPAHPTLDCSVKGNEHEQSFQRVAVEYFGQITRPDRAEYTWKCQRNGHAITCWGAEQ